MDPQTPQHQLLVAGLLLLVTHFNPWNALRMKQTCSGAPSSTILSLDFPQYAVESQIRLRGFDPAGSMLRLAPRPVPSPPP